MRSDSYRQIILARGPQAWAVLCFCIFQQMSLHLQRITILGLCFQAQLLLFSKHFNKCCSRVTVISTFHSLLSCMQQNVWEVIFYSAPHCRHGQHLVFKYTHLTTNKCMCVMISRHLLYTECLLAAYAVYRIRLRYTQ